MTHRIGSIPAALGYVQGTAASRLMADYPKEDAAATFANIAKVAAWLWDYWQAIPAELKAKMPAVPMLTLPNPYQPRRTLPASAGCRAAERLGWSEIDAMEGNDDRQAT